MARREAFDRSASPSMPSTPPCNRLHLRGNVLLSLLWLVCALRFVQAPPDDSKPLFLQFAQFEEQHGLARNAMQVRCSAMAMPVWCISVCSLQH